MRKFLKTNILEVFKTIYEAHGLIRDYVDKKEYENAQTLLADCQNTAIELGNLIEESEGEGFITISFLEEYCEALYETAISLSDEKNGHKVQKQLDKKIIKAENSVKNDIKVKLEVVFMPYKASMWDSLESIWKAADEDPDCNAYVVPIPYYDRKPGGAFDKFHYEGGEYPEYVPIVHYDAYKLEEHRPDIIYIHNPYDGNNYVTSVDPRFYSGELKKYTDCLVYVPYYVISTNISDIMLNIPCFYNTDKVVLQSKFLREKFKKVFSGYKTDKFAALGSPKFDPIVTRKKEDFILPDKWSDIIGSKKVIFYNTSIGTAINYTEKFLHKLERTIAFFNNNPDYVLWWRPHPLLESTFNSMRRDFLQKYLSLKNCFIENNIGIYDDTTELQRAIICSDMYYGDFKSSVWPLYCATGKLGVSAHISADEDVSCFEMDCECHSRDNSTFDVLKTNENFDGSAGWHIHQYIKDEITK